MDPYYKKLVMVDPTFLGLYENTFFGDIPNEIGNLKSLVGLYLYKNKLNGSIPRSLGDLTSLTHLYLYDNPFSGSIPEEIGNLKFLLSERIDLILSKNTFFGDIPNEIHNMKSLVGLYLYNNQLNGSIPRSLGELTSLTTLYLYGNQLSGTIPNKIGNVKSLVDLDLSQNQLNGIWETIFFGEAGVEAGVDGLLGLNTIRLNDDNFMKWRYQIESVLEGHELFGHFDGSVVSPPKFAFVDEKVANSEVMATYKNWLKLHKALLLIGTLSNDSIEYVIESKTTRDAWLSLTDRYATVSRARLNFLKT
ncbi:Hypothetical predicted protein [Prunus dulcis]|uniref:L domain-like protein n=1 Tax=Prunus dulcis TaxID=3755 RepID=A0A5E4GL83_PRUDU|nr:Hypothetical predicted protein [Prunus dulcis]